jgi:hypothetical protein
MALSPMWKIRLVLFLGSTEAWLRNLFLSPSRRAAQYRQAVAEEAFESWMDFGDAFDAAIEDRIASAKNRGEQGAVQFWQDVFASAREIDSDPDNRRKRDAMTRQT